MGWRRSWLTLGPLSFLGWLHPGHSSRGPRLGWGRRWGVLALHAGSSLTAEGSPRACTSPNPRILGEVGGVGVRCSTDTPHQRGPGCARKAEFQLSSCPACCLPPSPLPSSSIFGSLLSSLPPFPPPPRRLSSLHPQHSHLPLPVLSVLLLSLCPGAPSVSPPAQLP